MGKDKEIAEFKAASEVAEDKYYNIGFNDAKNSSELAMFENRKFKFGEEWMARCQQWDYWRIPPLGNLTRSPT